MKRILMVGDSLTAGHPRDNFAEVFARVFDKSVTPR
jgi:hypothetical protein